MRVRYVPKRGDLLWLDFTPHSGHEQAGRRPALVLSPRFYNRKTDLMLCCPITSQVKGYPFEVSVSSTTISGVILADQIKSVDWVARRAFPPFLAFHAFTHSTPRRCTLLTQSTL